MKAPENVDVRQAHTYFAQECFNLAWDLIEKKEREPEEMDLMIHLAHASLYHWSRRADCTDQNLSIGYWQLSRVYALAGLGDSALKAAETCLAYAQQHGVARIFVGYAHEALARAYAVVAMIEKQQIHLEQAINIAQALPDDEKDQLLADLKDLSQEDC